MGTQSYKMLSALVSRKIDIHEVGEQLGQVSFFHSLVTSSKGAKGATSQYIFGQ